MKLYLDHNASTPPDEQVVQEMLSCLSGGAGNPSSSHRFGRMARARIDTAREQVAALVGAHPSQVYLTSGGTEANNLALRATTQGQPPGRIAVSTIEHPSVLEAAAALQAQGWKLDRIAVDEECRVTEPALGACVHSDSRLVSVMTANNETGVIQDIAGLARFAREAGVVFHTDAVQAAGKIPLDFDQSGAHLMTLSAHKIYGPQGAGALVVDKSLELTPLLYGGGQERGLRAGTENVAAIVGFGVAAELAASRLAGYGTKLRHLRDRLESGLAQHPQITVFAQGAQRLPNTVQLAVAGIDGETLLMQLDREGIAVSSGSACSSDSNEPSHVLLAMGVDPEVARGAIRVSLGAGTSDQDIDYLLKVLDQQVQWVQKAGQAAGW